MTINNEDINGVVSSFRPLIRGFFFYVRHLAAVAAFFDGNVSVPSFGDSFFIFCRKTQCVYPIKKVSVPSFGDSFFIILAGHCKVVDGGNVSVPSFGDSFFISNSAVVNAVFALLVSVPSFGDSFFILSL